MRRKILLILCSVLLSSCVTNEPDPPALEAAVKAFRNKPRRVARFFQALLPRILEWGEATNPLSTMCAPNYQVKEYGTSVSDCASNRSIFTSAKVLYGGVWANTNTGLLEVACRGDMHQAHQQEGKIDFRISVDPSTFTATIVITTKGVMYGITDDWKYFTDQTPFNMSLNGIFNFQKLSSQTTPTYLCIDATAPILLDGEGWSCGSIVEFFAEACDSYH